MKRRRGFGVGNQGFHPRARGTLSPEARRGQARVYRASDPDATEQYFVPSFSIMRHLERHEERDWQAKSKQIGSLLGRYYEVMPPQNMVIKSIEQKGLISMMRNKAVSPSGDQMKDLVFNVRDGLTETLSRAPESLEFGLGRLAVFGKNQNKLAFTLQGWKGWRDRYGMEDMQGNISPLGALLLETQVATGAISTAFPDTSFALTDIATSPHLTIARSSHSIKDHQLRDIQSRVDDLGIDYVMVGDPVISYKLAPSVPSETVHIRHSWATLAENIA